MCEKTNYKIPNPRIDKCMKIFVYNLKLILRPMFIIKACCCGHKKYPMTIVMLNDITKEKICECGQKQWEEHKSSFYNYKDLKMVAQECNVKGCKCKKFKVKNDSRNKR